MTDNTMDFSTILASSVHDMKNSLTLLLSSLDDIIHECKPESCPVQSKLVQVQHEGQRVNRNLIQMLTLYRIDSANYFVNIAEHSVEDLLEDVALENEAILSARDITLETSCDAGLTGFFDRELVSGVINTIINNSYKYTRDTIRLRAAAHDGYLVFYVEDNGPGYPPHMLHEKTNHSPAVNFSSGNTGLGLYFAARVADLHSNHERHGFTETRNDGIDGGGSFAIYLP